MVECVAAADLGEVAVGRRVGVGLDCVEALICLTVMLFETPGNSA